jgi:hypothetical protein
MRRDQNRREDSFYRMRGREEWKKEDPENRGRV